MAYEKYLGFLLVLILIFFNLWFFINSPLFTNQDRKIIIPFVSSNNKIVSEASFIPQLLSLNQIFSHDHDWTATLSAQKLRTMIATGDVIPARSVNFKTIQAGDWRWPFLKTALVLKNAEITFINLETPLIDNCPLTNRGMIFCGQSRHIEGLKFAGIDVVNLANNHAGNYGPEGIASTRELLEEADMLAVGLQNPTYKEVNNIGFAFLGYNHIYPNLAYLSWAEEEKIRQEVALAKQNAEIVVVAFHWGVEYVSQPTPIQQQLARLAIDAGADLIIGNHPHWIQPVEIYKNKLIVYAHGNFIFDQMWSQKTREGVVGRYTFYEDRLVDVEFLPIQIDNYGQPHFLEGINKQSILKEMERQSLELRF